MKEYFWRRCFLNDEENFKKLQQMSVDSEEFTLNSEKDLQIQARMS